MGGGSWTKDSFATYSCSVGRSVSSLTGEVTTKYSSVQQMYTQRDICEELNPKDVIRECVDSKEHPNTLPVILALDVTGSMGSSAMEVAKKLNVVMTKLYESVKDVEFMVMGIGDIVYDDAPIQVSQFESDVRIAKWLDKIYFEGGGGGNNYESYTAAWYIGAYRTKLDCWKRGRKGVIITMGDEPLNPVLEADLLSDFVGDTGVQDESILDTANLYKAVSEKYNVYHLNVMHGYFNSGNKESFGKYLDSDHLFDVTVNNIADKIVDIVTSESKKQPSFIVEDDLNPEGISKESVAFGSGIGEISW